MGFLSDMITVGIDIFAGDSKALDADLRVMRINDTLREQQEATRKVLELNELNRQSDVQSSHNTYTLYHNTYTPPVHPSLRHEQHGAQWEWNDGYSALTVVIAILLCLGFISLACR